MVLGLRSKNRKGLPVQLDYLVHVQEIKPWPPSQSLRSIQSVVLHWENGDRSSGYLTTNVIDGKVEFGESFRLPVKLSPESSRKGGGFQKNNLEFYLYEIKKEKAVRGQLLGSAVINLADHGVITESLSFHAPINVKKSAKNTAQQPSLYITFQSFDRDSSCSSPKSSLSKEASLDKDGSESVSEVTKEVIDDGSEIAAFTDDDDDDLSAHSSLSSHSFALKSTRVSSGQHDKPVALNMPSGSELLEDNTGRINREPALSRHVAMNPVVNMIAEAHKDTNGSSSQPSSTTSYKDMNESSTHPSSTGLSTGKLRDPVSDIAANVMSPDVQSSLGMSPKWSSFEIPEINQMDEKALSRERNGLEDSLTIKPYTDGWKNKEEKEQQKNGHDREILDVEKRYTDDHIVRKLPRDAAREKVKLRSNTLVANRPLEVPNGTLINNKLKHVNSAPLHLESTTSNGLSRNSQFLEKASKVDVSRGVNNGNIKAASEREEKPSGYSDNKDELKSKVEMLEEELKEAAALEVGLYSVVAEHGGSTSKVHAPVWRLSRFYFHACKARSKARSASAARAVVSGLVLVSKACGNDVPRLTFWLSNSIVLRAIINNERTKTKRFSPKSMFSPHEEKNDMIEGSDEWEEPQTFVVALEKIEAWIFSRIIESVWWQTLTPHMQSTAVKSTSTKKSHARMPGLGDQEQGNFSIDLWKKAFKDACERLCPVRASGHECGCLPLLARLVMEQLVDRLDVAMFNAILRESAEDMPTDPMSDPISDAKVLPIPAGKSSFGAGVQLKNAVGNWSRFLTDLFGIDDNDILNNENESDDNRRECETHFKAFHLLNALSDLMMLPFEMLADKSTRKEVCPTFGAPMIRRVLSNFVPDEFNPDPIPEVFLDSLDSEDFSDDEEVLITSFPWTAAPTVYSAPPTSTLRSITGEVGNETLLRSGSTLLTSGDELDEFDSPITSIDINNLKVSPSTVPDWTPKGNKGRKVVRYRLLREVWRDGE
ncbi:uncharacterized protein LOC120007566 [Tripterygium wilfordii]|uniref:uncharacterized protein LOC120007566 n=1 Tax=Tripterygium wilfordii TaxID=458696 RepID=UPI0018F7FDDF|nr:uncharacterized protein LOC120007566 [Tripterygium wilfordii]